MQEGPPSKRLRQDFDSEDDEEDGFAERQVENNDFEDSEGDSDEARDGEVSQTEEEEDGAEDGIGPEEIPIPSSSKLLSRVSFVPRKTLPPTRKRNSSASNTQKTSFASFGISSTLLTALASMSIRTPTEIQTVCIPPLLQGEFWPSVCLHPAHFN